MRFTFLPRFRIVFALALASGLALLGLWLGQGAASAHGGPHHRVVEVNFTKWVTDASSFPWSMDGVVTSGDLGTGDFNGQALSLESTDGITRIKAIYSIDADRDFTARVFVRQDDATGHAVIIGNVTQGWRRGAVVIGEYDTAAVCPIATPGNVFGTVCFQVSLRIIGGFGR